MFILTYDYAHMAAKKRVGPVTTPSQSTAHYMENLNSKKCTVIWIVMIMKIIILFSRLKDNDGDTACNYKVDDIIPSLLK